MLRDYTERLAGWQLKALREAKLATDWTAPNLEYEDAARSFLYTIMADDGFVAEALDVCAPHRAGRSSERPGADAAEADCAGRAGLSIRAPSSGTRAWWIPTIAGQWISRGASLH